MIFVGLKYKFRRTFLKKNCNFNCRNDLLPGVRIWPILTSFLPLCCSLTPKKCCFFLRKRVDYYDVLKNWYEISGMFKYISIKTMKCHQNSIFAYLNANYWDFHSWYILTSVKFVIVALRTSWLKKNDDFRPKWEQNNLFFRIYFCP